MNLQLLSVSDPGQRIIVHEVPFNIGRKSDNHLVISERSVSRYHARIEQSGDHVLLVDLKSKGGSFVNGRRIYENRLLRNGDMITIGSESWQLDYDAPAARKSQSRVGYIFISYSHADSKIADILIQRLDQVGYRVWVDRRGISGGEHWRQEIVDAIENCTVFILGLSRNSVQSENVRKELDIADSAQRPIIPVEFQQTPDLPTYLKYQLAGIQRITLLSNFEDSFRQLLSALDSNVTPTHAPWAEPGKTARGKPWLTFLILILIIITCVILGITLLPQ